MNKRFLSMVIVMLVVSLNAMASPSPIFLCQRKGTMTLLRKTANEDPNGYIGSIAITNDTAGDWDNRPTEANGLTVFSNDGVNLTINYYVGIAACAEGEADKTFTVNMWLWWKGKGPAVKACSIAYITGTQCVVKYPHSPYDAAASSYWADTGVVTSYYPLAVASGTDGGNSVKIIVLDIAGADAMYAEVLNADGTTGDEAGNVTIYWFNVGG